MKQAISAISAEALVSTAMKGAGLQYQFIAQQYRAKVAVKLNERNKVVFFLSYKKIHEQLPDVIDSAKQLRGRLRP